MSGSLLVMIPPFQVGIISPKAVRPETPIRQNPLPVCLDIRSPRICQSLRNRLAGESHGDVMVDFPCACPLITMRLLTASACPWRAHCRPRMETPLEQACWQLHLIGVISLTSASSASILHWMPTGRLIGVPSDGNFDPVRAGPLWRPVFVLRSRELLASGGLSADDFLQ